MSSKSPKFRVSPSPSPMPGGAADDLDLNRHALVALAVLWVALLVLWPLVAVYGAAPHVRCFAHRLAYHPSTDCTDEDGWYASDICGRRPLAWVVRR